jgi:hypothetical protein
MIPFFKVRKFLLICDASPSHQGAIGVLLSPPGVFQGGHEKQFLKMSLVPWVVIVTFPSRFALFSLGLPFPESKTVS